MGRRIGYDALVRSARRGTFDLLPRFEANRHSALAAEVDQLLNSRPACPFRDQHPVDRPSSAQRFSNRVNSGQD